jgi:hypothetical protein
LRQRAFSHQHLSGEGAKGSTVRHSLGHPRMLSLSGYGLRQTVMKRLVTRFRTVSARLTARLPHDVIMVVPRFGWLLANRAAAQNGHSRGACQSSANQIPSRPHCFELLRVRLD